jgi:membrane fusion protein, copper/silver efflux system
MGCSARAPRPFESGQDLGTFSETVLTPRARKANDPTCAMRYPIPAGERIFVEVVTLPMNKTTAVCATLLFVIGAFVAGRYTGKPRPSFEHGATRRVLYYVDPMHPAYRSDKPGIAPDCGMPLEPVYEGEDSTTKLGLPAGAVSISGDKQQLIGVRVETVGKNSGSRLIRTIGRVEADDNRVYRLMAATEGWVQSLQNSPAGTIVKKNDLLAMFYSREFRNVEQAYLGSLASLERLKKAPDDANGTGDANLHINEEQLRALGMGDPQLKDLARTRQLTRYVEITSPIDGIVLQRSISPMQRFDKGAELYRIADLTKIWILADLFGDEARLLAPGTRVKVTVRELSKTLYAQVSQAPALFDPASRTLKLRLEADNPGLVLRPDMFVDLEFNAKVPAELSIPQEAVLDSGLRKIVYVETSDGVFEPRPVETGAAYGGSITVTRGLVVGDNVVVSGNFLIDSESRLHSALPTFSSARTSAAQPTQTAAAEDRDPVCGMKLEPKQVQSSGHVEKYHGELFHFCSDNCQKKFQHDPGKYADVKVGKAGNSSNRRSQVDD